MKLEIEKSISEAEFPKAAMNLIEEGIFNVKSKSSSLGHLYLMGQTFKYQ
ncbi:hypothetical protein MOE39_01065 [Bacillus cereus]|nr:hypothetical protein [Bacillus cereus]